MGANRHLTPDDVAAIDDETFDQADVLLTCLEMPLETVVASLQRAKRHGLVTILNPAPAIASECIDPLLPMVDLITPNQTEATIYSGIDGHSPEDARLAAQELRRRGAGDVIVTLGSAGCVYVGENMHHMISAPQVEAVDTTGAGDTFNGALAVALSEGRSIVEAARWACIAGAFSVTRKGAQPSLPYREDLAEWP
jgi:ribokinase